MKKVIIAIMLLLYGTVLQAQLPVKFDLKCSELYATYDFVTKLSDLYFNNEFKTLFSGSKYDTPAYRNKIAALDTLRLNYSYAFGQYPQPLKAALMSSDLLEKNLVISSSLTDFQNRSIGIIPSDDLAAFSDIITMFLPVYHELVFKPNEAALEIQKHNLMNYIDEGRFADYFNKGLLFYGTQWSNAIPFELDLLPSLDRQNLGARAFFNVAICEASVDLKDHKTFFSVAMHEIYHIIYDNQPLKTKNNIQRWFDDTHSANSQYALLLLNEVLATALGNAYIMEQLNGKLTEEDWYENKYIKAMSKAIYPTVKKYIEAGRPIDESFIKTYVQTYDAKFPGWTSELEHLFMYRYIVTDDPGDWRYFRKTYRYYSNNRLAAPVSPVEMAKMRDMPVTKVIVISQKNKQELEMLRSEIPELKNVSIDPKKEFIKVFVLQDRTKLLLVNRYSSTVEDLMKKNFPNGTLPK